METDKLYKYLDFNGGLMMLHYSKLPDQNDDKSPIDRKEVRAFPKIGGECFESVYLGINMNADEKSKIISVARKLNPDIKIYQMGIDANAFKLNTELIK